MSALPERLAAQPALAALARGADVVDVKHFVSRRPLRPFVLDFFSYKPAWLRGLYGVRTVLARCLGLGDPPTSPLPAKPEDLPMEPGQRLDFFVVHETQEDRFWIGGVKDKHLTAHVAVLADTRDVEQGYHVVTVVRFNHWTGPVYYNIIRPFHHLVVLAMGRYAAG